MKVSTIFGQNKYGALLKSFTVSINLDNATREHFKIIVIEIYGRQVLALMYNVYITSQLNMSYDIKLHFNRL